MRKSPWGPFLAGTFWLFFGLVIGSEKYLSIKAEAPTVLQVPFLTYLTWQTLNWGIWTVFTPLVVAFARRVPLQLAARPVALHLGLCVLLALAEVGIRLFLVRWFNPAGATSHGPLLASYLSMLSSLAHFDVLIYAVVVGCTYSYDSHFLLKERELQTAVVQGQLDQARLENIRIQLQPHFLFNTLHAIAGLVREGSHPQAVTMIAGLSDLLRASLHTVDRPTVPLAEELDMLKRYLDIQQVRFSDRLAIDLRVEASALEAMVPSLLLQPLVENAIKHGLNQAGTGQLDIHASRKGDLLEITIANDGAKLRPDWQAHEGLGLKTTRARLQQLYGATGQLSLENQREKGVVARVSLPHTTRPWRV